MIRKIIEFIISVFTYKEEKTSSKIEQVVEEPKIEIIEEEIKEEPIINQVENNIETTSKEVYKMLTNKERQTYLKKLGLYTKAIDNIRGSGQKKAEKQFNIIFLNKSNDTYTEETDKLLRIIYKSYVASPYMVSTDWKYFKNFKSSEFYCKCNKKYCDGWNGLKNKIPMKLLMALQYVRNYYDKPITLTSTVRCKTHNAKVGGVSKSKHMEFKASDFTFSGIKTNEVVKLIYTGSNKLPFVNYSYTNSTNMKTSVHVDVKI